MESKESVLIDQGGYFDGTIDKVEKVLHDYYELERSVLDEVFTLLLKRKPRMKDLDVLKPKKVFRFMDDNRYEIEIYLGKKYISIGTVERMISLERGTYVVRFHPAENVNSTLVKSMREMKVGPEAQGLLNRDLDGAVEGTPIWKDMGTYRFNAWFVRWVDNTTIEISLKSGKELAPAVGWKILQDDEE